MALSPHLTIDKGLLPKPALDFVGKVKAMEL